MLKAPHAPHEFAISCMQPSDTSLFLELGKSHPCPWAHWDSCGASYSLRSRRPYQSGLLWYADLSALPASCITLCFIVNFEVLSEVVTLKMLIIIKLLIHTKGMVIKEPPIRTESLLLSHSTMCYWILRYEKCIRWECISASGGTGVPYN